MHDEIDGRLWAAHHRDLAAALRRIGAAIMIIFCKIHKIEFDAPWTRQGSTNC